VLVNRHGQAQPDLKNLDLASVRHCALQVTAERCSLPYWTVVGHVKHKVHASPGGDQAGRLAILSNVESDGLAVLVDHADKLRGTAVVV
jgi:hypothetical protein